MGSDFDLGSDGTSSAFVGSSEVDVVLTGEVSFLSPLLFISSFPLAFFPYSPISSPNTDIIDN